MDLGGTRLRGERFCFRAVMAMRAPTLVLHAGFPVGRPCCKRHSPLCARRLIAVRLRRPSFEAISNSFARTAFEFRGSSVNVFPVVPCDRIALRKIDSSEFV
jgi:hypothetical protein